MHANKTVWITAIQIEEWIQSLPLAPASRAKVRNVFSMIFRHGIRWGWLDKKPVAMVRVSSKRLHRGSVSRNKSDGIHLRRTYSSLLDAMGDDVKVVQELIRHAKISTTMEVYTQEVMEKACRAAPCGRCAVQPGAEEFGCGAVKNELILDCSREIGKSPRICRLNH